MSSQVLGRLKRSVLVTSTGASTRIEGARLSDEDIEKLMRGISIQKFADRDKQEVKGYYELLQNVFDAWKHIRFSENTIKHFHKELLKYVQKDRLHRGEYKKTENKVHMIDAEGKSVGILFDTTPAYLTPKEMQELVEAAQNAFKENKYPPLLIIGNFLVEFLKIHPFQDGNGRISRILTNLLLLHSGYQYMPYVSHEKLVEDNMYLVQLPFVPASKAEYDINKMQPDETILLTMYPEIARCVSCNTCTKSCPQDIETMKYIQMAVRGDIARCAEISFDCIQCGLCAMRCPADIKHYHVSQLARRLRGKYIDPKSKNLSNRLKEIENRKYDDEINKLMKMPKKEIIDLYKSRKIEAEEGKGLGGD